ncbi:MAG: PQQ-binding-like beta-propeller repeat protein [Acidobacteriota bacterium]
MRSLSFCLILTGLSGVTSSPSFGADWLTDGGNPQRTAWQKDEHTLSPSNVKNMQILWKLQLDNKPQQMHSLFPPLVIDHLRTAAGEKQVAIVSGISDNIYAIDVATGTLIWKKHFDYPEPANVRPGNDDPLCPEGALATPVVGPPNASGQRPVYALAGDGQLHTLNAADGEELSQPIHFLGANAKAYALNLWQNAIYTTTAQGCHGNPNQMWAMRLDDPTHKVLTASPKSGGLWGRTGAAIDSSGVAWAPTGDGRYDKETQTYGNGLVGGKIFGDELKIADYFIPSNWSWLQKRDLDFQVTPAIFTYKGRELMVTASKECRVYLMDPKNPGGDDHQTPLDRTPLLCNEEVNFASAGIWGSMASWEDSKGTRWVLTPFWGPVHPKLKVPITNGPVTHGAVLAFKVEEKGGKLQLTPAWISRDMDQAEPPVIANGVVFAYASGENTTQAYADLGLRDSSKMRIAASKHATFYALDGETGKELYSSGDQIKSFVHFGGLSVANGRVYLGTYDSVLYCFGLPGTK